MRMAPVLGRLAWRYLWRNHRRTIIMLGAITVGVWAMIFMTALSRGMVEQMLEDGISVLPGHVQMHHPDYVDDPSIDAEGGEGRPGGLAEAAIGSGDQGHARSEARPPAAPSALSSSKPHSASICNQ